MTDKKKAPGGQPGGKQELLKAETSISENSAFVYMPMAELTNDEFQDLKTKTRAAAAEREVLWEQCTQTDPAPPFEFEPSLSVFQSPAQQIAKPIIEHAVQRAGLLNAGNYDSTDAGNADLFRDLFGDRVRHDSTTNQWYLWTGTRWRPDSWIIAPTLAKIAAHVLKNWLPRMHARDLKDAARHVQRSFSSTGIRALLYQAAADPALAVTLAEFDANGFLLNAPAGTVDLRTGEVHPHHPRDMITKITGYSPGHTGAELWAQVIDSATCGRPELAAAMQRLFGSAAIGIPGKDKAAIFYGSGANQKSTIVESAADALGDYASSTDIQTLMESNRSSGHTEDIASLLGVRFLRTSEPGAGGRWDEGRFKALPGGDTIAASHKHGRSFEFRPCFTLCMSTNHKPRITGRDSGIWRRIWLLPFDYVVPEDQRDPRFREHLMAESGPAILQWIIDGAREWIAEGWGRFDIVDAATLAYHESEDVLAVFFAECCTLNPHRIAPAGQLRKAYEDWCTKSGERPFSGRAWREALEERGFNRRKTRAGFQWEGIGIDSDSPF